jgi:peptidyl serine alpha-galactosyltransferase
MAKKKNFSVTTIGIAVLLIVIGWCGYAIYRISATRSHLDPVPKISEIEAIPPERDQTIRDEIDSPRQETKFTFTQVPKRERTQHSPEDTKQPELDQIHVIYSTDCSAYQDWQTLLVFHSAKAVHQKGPLTRIASGCEPDKQIQLTELYKKLYPDYHVHFTPDFKTDPKTGRKYDFYNKPYGVLHWLDHAEPKITPGTIVALIDPDFIFLRPLTTQMSGQANTIVSGPVKPSEVFDKVSKGKPVAQQYGLGAPWVNDNHKKFNRTRICGAGSPCLRVENENIGVKYYALGPPYILERDDLHRLTKSWTTLVPRVYEGYPYLLAEMYAYSMAAAHEDLPHLRVDHFMVSNVEAGGEGWKWIDALGDDVCRPPVDGIYHPEHPLPTFLHYCQTYQGLRMHFQKRSIPQNIFSCESSLFPEPSQTSALKVFTESDQVP